MKEFQRALGAKKKKPALAGIQGDLQWRGGNPGVGSVRHKFQSCPCWLLTCCSTLGKFLSVSDPLISSVKWESWRSLFRWKPCVAASLSRWGCATWWCDSHSLSLLVPCPPDTPPIHTPKWDCNPSHKKMERILSSLFSLPYHLSEQLFTIKFHLIFELSII